MILRRLLSSSSSSSGGPYGSDQPLALKLVNGTPRYASGPATFFRVGHVPYQEASECDIGIVGVPFDGGVTSRPGSRHGPRGVREQSADHIRAFAFDGFSPLETARVLDLGDVPVQRPFDLVSAHDEIEAGMRVICRKGIFPLTVGGDHSISLPILRAVAAERRRPLALIHVDSHADTGDDYLGSRFHHGSPFRRAAEEGLIDPKRTVQIGIRGTLGDPRAWQFSYDSGMRVVTMDEFEAMDVAELAAEIKTIVGDSETYVTFDIDALDPAFAPGTGTPEAGGLTTRQAQTLLRAIDKLDLDVVGADLVEVAPPLCPSNITALAGANLLHELLRIMARSVDKRRATS